MSWLINDRQPSIGVSNSQSYVLVEQSAEEGVTTEPAQLVIHPSAVPQLVKHLQAAAYRISGPDLSGLKLALPRPLLQYLDPAKPKKLKVKAAQAVYGTTSLALLPREQLKAENLRVRPQLSKWRGKGPHSEDGYYAVPGVNLLQDNAAYSLVWLPVERRFGTYDAEHTELMVFRSKPSWTKLLSDIDRYFAATNGDDFDAELAEYLRPWPQHPFVPTG